MDRIIKQIEATKDHDILLWEDEKGTSGYLSIKHKARISDTDSEIVVAWPDVPDLVKALSQAALELNLRASYMTGYKQGAGDMAKEGAR